MITHKEALEKLEQIAETTVYHFPSYDEDGYCNDDDYDEYPVDKELIKFMTEYIKQQEKLQAEHEALKHDIAIYKETLNSIKTICNEPSPSITLSLVEKSNRYIETDNLVNTYDEKL